ncbi:DNA-processing protein DprA [Leucobacter sp. BZR 635]
MSVSPRPSKPLIRADTETRKLLGSLCGERELSAAALDVLLARAVWSRLTEPGDAAAGELIEALGPQHALDLVAGKYSPHAITKQLRGRGSGDVPLSQRQLSAALTRWRPRLDRTATVRDLETALATQMTLVTPEDARWPSQVDDLGSHSPHVLWVRGSVEALRAQALAVVGARACTGYGSHVTTELSSEACTAGFTIISGAAYGVDAVAHRTALALGSPTVAVLAGGADRPYPAAHDQLLTRVASQGAICSELVPGSAPTRWRFLQRNRIIAALAGAVLVTEAGVRSGTLNTAGHAAELGRLLGAVPGAITSAASAGCHRLVREYGAVLVTNGQELLELLGADPASSVPGGDGQASSDSPDRTPPLHVRVLDALPLTGGRSAADTAVRAGLSRRETADTLAELELLRYVVQTPPDSEGIPMWQLVRRT